ncbi:MAG: response regulator transcription factor [Oscillospiraceae bacterium]|nr:response regulator transcription factor [Oscillospiraceae bacterium]
MEYRILIVEDDEVIARVIGEHLSSWGYQVLRVADFANVLREFSAFSPHLVLLDISLPFYNGYHWCAEIRKLSSVPIVFLSSASDNMNLVMAMNLGGDDFIPKPFALPVLTAKVQAILRRTYDFGAAAQLLECGGAVLNVSDGTLRVRDAAVELTKNEWKILQMLMERRGAVVSRAALMTRLWESDAFVDENTLTVNVNRLRKKLDAAGLSDFITTKKGAGYRVG